MEEHIPSIRNEFINSFYKSLEENLNRIVSVKGFKIEPQDVFSNPDFLTQYSLTIVVPIISAKLNGAFALDFDEKTILHVSKEYSGKQSNKIDESAIQAAMKVVDDIFAQGKDMLKTFGHKFEVKPYYYVLGDSKKISPNPIATSISLPLFSSFGQMFFHIGTFQDTFNRILIDDEYVLINMNDIQPNDILNFDVHIYLPTNNKVLPYREKFTIMDERTLERFQNYRVKHFYIRKEEYNNYVEFMSNKIVHAINDEQLTEEESKEIAQKQVGNMLKGIFESREDKPVLINKSVDIVEKIVDPNMTQENAFKDLLKITKQIFNYENHSANVFTYATLLAIAMGYNHHKALKDLATGALLHDIGLSVYPKELLEIPYSQMNENQQSEFEQHPLDGVKLIKKYKANVSQEALLIVAEHHERHDGFGYPRKMRGVMQYELSKIVAIADTFDTLTSKGPDNDSLAPMDAFQEIFKMNEGSDNTPFNPVLIKKLQEFIETFGNDLDL